MERPAAYAHLGLTSSASLTQVRQAYRRAVQRWHPDRHPDDTQAQARFVLIQAAYRCLQQPTPTPSPAVPPPTIRLPGDDVRVRLLVPLASVFAAQQGHVCVRVAQVCPRCAGQGGVCVMCQGTGQVFRARTLTLAVPAGVMPGHILRVRGQGHAGPYFTEPGDVCVEIAWRRRGPWICRAGRLERKVHLPRRIHRHGGLWRLRTPDGRRGTLTLPPTPHHHWIAVPGQGLPRPDGTRDPLWLWVL